MTDRKYLIAFSLVIASGTPLSTWGCERIQLQQPRLGETITSVRPDLVWEKGDSFAITRLQVVSYIPEGGVLRTLDIATQENFFRPTVDLTKSRAAVKVLISRNCTDSSHEKLLAQPAAFFIDSSQACPKPVNPEAVLREGYAAVSWQNSTEAVGYESYVANPSMKKADIFAAAPGDNHLRLPAPGAPSLLKLRSVCPTGVSAWVSVRLTPRL